MAGRLLGKKAFVLGVSAEGGIGEAIAKRYIVEGARVAIGGRSIDRVRGIASAIGATAVQCDITDEVSLAEGMRTAADQLEGLSLAVNVAGVNHSRPVAEETAEALLDQARTHFVGTALFIRFAAEQMGEGGSIISLSSVTAELTGPGLAAYAATKVAADKVVQIAAVEYADKRIRVNSLAPGLTRTRMTAGHFANDKVVAAFVRETPFGRLMAPEDVAAAAVWLGSDECTATGDLIRVSGGIHLRRLPTAHDMRG